MIRERKIQIAVVSFLVVTTINIIGTVTFPAIASHLMPFLFLLIPLVLQKKINLYINIRHTITGILSALSVILPVFLYYIYSGARIEPPPLIYIVITYLFVAFPEEAFFRGFLMDSIGCDIRGVFVSSLLFSVAHWHRFVLYGDYLAPLTFFPALIMGFLYMKTKNILPSTLFHGTCNTVLFVLTQMH